VPSAVSLAGRRYETVSEFMIRVAIKFLSRLNSAVQLCTRAPFLVRVLAAPIVFAKVMPRDDIDRVLVSLECTQTGGRCCQQFVVVSLEPYSQLLHYAQQSLRMAMHSRSLPKLSRCFEWFLYVVKEANSMRSRAESFCK
jgi:hypothetical protein